jgi:hypothetical protein
MIRKRDLEDIEYDGDNTLAREEIERLGVSKESAAALLRIDPRTMRRYLQESGTEGSTPMPFSAYALLRNLKP